MEVHLHFPKLKEEHILFYIISQQEGNYGGYIEYNVEIKFLHWLFLLQQKYSNVAFPKEFAQTNKTERKYINTYKP